MIHLAFLAVRNGRNAGDMIPVEKSSKGETLYYYYYFQKWTSYNSTTKDVRPAIALLVLQENLKFCYFSLLILVPRVTMSY